MPETNFGTAMRRGLVAVGGAAGDGVGTRMIAGTIVIGGPCGRHAGAGMRRGTIVLMESNDDSALSYCRHSCRANRWNPQFMRLLLVYLEQAGFRFAQEWIDADYTFYHGDRLALGKAEILVRSSITPTSANS